MTVLTPPGYVQAGTYSAKLDRQYITTAHSVADMSTVATARQGFYSGRVPAFIVSSGMDCIISQTAGIIRNTFATGAGDYKFVNDNNIVVSHPASSPTLNRYDIVGFQVKDNFYDSSGLNTVIPAIIQGANSAGTPTDPALPASFIPVYRGVVNAGVTSPVLTSLVKRTTNDGGMLPVDDVTDRGAIVSPWDGLAIYRRDRDWKEIHDGTAWRVQGVAICTSVADRDGASGITNPVNGQLAVTIDTYTVWLRRSGVWEVWPGAAITDTQNTVGTTTSSGAWTSTLTGGIACGFVFVAPPSGSVRIINTARISSTVGLAYCGVRVKTGAVVGSGTDVLADAVANSVQGIGGSPMTYTRAKRITGLTPGSSYNVQQRYIVDSGQGAFEDKYVDVSPA